MPIFTYKCGLCGITDQRLGGLDDHSAICVECGGVMVRLGDPFEITLWDEATEVCHGQAPGEIPGRF